MPEPNRLQTTNFYDLLGLKPGASVQDIRRTYRDLSKRYHPDTTTLPPAIATSKFQELNEAYATLSSPERRLAYDYKIGYSRLRVMQAPRDLNQPVSRDRPRQTTSAYLDPTDRPLSAGEIFALFILGLTFAACLVLVIAIGLTQGELALEPLVPPDLVLEIDPTSLNTANDPATTPLPLESSINLKSPPDSALAASSANFSAPEPPLESPADDYRPSEKVSEIEADSDKLAPVTDAKLNQPALNSQA